jgi:hypothetical protein
MTKADFHPEATRGEIHLSPKECLLNETPRWTPKRFLEDSQFGPMRIESCDLLDLHATTKDNIAGRTLTGKGTINYGQTTWRLSPNTCCKEGSSRPMTIFTRVFGMEENIRLERRKKDSDKSARCMVHILDISIVDTMVQFKGERERESI